MPRRRISAGQPRYRTFAQPQPRLAGGIEERQRETPAPVLPARPGVDAGQQFEHRSAAHPGQGAEAAVDDHDPGHALIFCIGGF